MCRNLSDNLLINFVSDDEYTRQTQTMCYCFKMGLSCNETTVALFNFITDRARYNTKYCHLFVTGIFVRNNNLVNR